jgi:hypothetical protein
MKARILPFFMLLKIAVATQFSYVPPKVVKFALAPTPIPYLIDAVADLKYFPLANAFKVVCVQMSLIDPIVHVVVRKLKRLEKDMFFFLFFFSS